MWKITIFLIIILCGCSNTEQRATMTETLGEQTITTELCVSKSSFMYWSKFQADTNTFGMEAKVYNAESRPDPAAVEAIAESAIRVFLDMLGAGL